MEDIAVRVWRPLLGFEPEASSQTVARGSFFLPCSVDLRCLIQGTCTILVFTFRVICFVAGRYWASIRSSASRQLSLASPFSKLSGHRRFFSKYSLYRKYLLKDPTGAGSDPYRLQSSMHGSLSGPHRQDPKSFERRINRISLYNFHRVTFTQ